MFDYTLWKDETDLKKRRSAQDAARWLFEPSTLNNSLENICHFLNINITMVRDRAKSLTKDDVKKAEFIEREHEVDPSRYSFHQKSLENEDDFIEDDGD